MLSFERVALADIVPDPNNPRKQFKGLDVLAAQFDSNAERPGEPFCPICVAKDGSSYRIVDGERRFRAMRDAGKVDSCLCMVADGMGDLDTMLMMVGTDNKDKLTPAEKAMGFQQMLLLGVDSDSAVSYADDSYVKDAAKVENVKRRLRNQRDRHGYKAVQMDFMTLMEVGEIEDDAVASEVLALADKGTGYGTMFHKRRNEALSEQRARKEHREFMESFAELGVDVVHEKPEKDGPYALIGRVWYSDIKRLAKEIELAKEKGRKGFLFWIKPENEFKGGYMDAPILYAESVPGEPELSQERRDAIERDNAIADVEERFEAYAQRRRDYVRDLMLSNTLQPFLEGDERSRDLADGFWSLFVGSVAYADASEVLGDIAPTFPNIVTASVWDDLNYTDERDLASAIVDGKCASDGICESITDYIDLVAMLNPVGYVRQDDELADFDLLWQHRRDYLEGGE